MDREADVQLPRGMFATLRLLLALGAGPNG